VEAMKTKADIQMRLAEIKIRGYIKDWDEFMILYMIMTEQIDMPGGALYEGGDNNGEDMYKRGLFNPLRRIDVDGNSKERLARFAQHFPMLFRNGQKPDEVISSLSDYLYDPKSNNPQSWMNLIDRKGVDGPLVKF
jgi:hypothetical protein